MSPARRAGLWPVAVVRRRPIGAASCGPAGALWGVMWGVMWGALWGVMWGVMWGALWRAMWGKSGRAMCGAMCSLMALSSLATAAAAAPIYRCGNTYQQMPCPDGRPVQAADPRDEAQRLEALKRVAAERQAAETLATENRNREQALKPQQRPAGIAAAPERAASTPGDEAGTGRKHGKPKKDKKARPRQADDKTLYSPREAGRKTKEGSAEPGTGKSSEPEARMPGP